MAQETFNKTLKDFNATLDANKIDDVTQSLEKLKEALKYDEAIQNINNVKQQIEDLNEKIQNNTDITQRGRITKQADIVNLERLTKELQRYEGIIDDVTDAETRSNEAKKMAVSLDFESVNTSNQKIASKLREVQENKKLIADYEKNTHKTTKQYRIDKRRS